MTLALLASVGVLAADQVRPRRSTGAAPVTVYLNQNFDACADWHQDQANWNNGTSMCGADGLNGNGNVHTSNGGRDEIKADAACHGGSGKCLHHRRADGDDNNAGAAADFNWNNAGFSNVDHFYMCFWINYEAGMGWRNSAANATGVTPTYTKEIIVNDYGAPSGPRVTGGPTFAVGFHGNDFGIFGITPLSIGNAAPNGKGWTNVYGAGNVSDGTWHQLELEVGLGATGMRWTRIDGVVAENTTGDFGTANLYKGINIGSNQALADTDATPSTDVGPDKTTRFDDLYIASTRPSGTAGVCGAINP